MGIWQQINDTLRRGVRRREGRDPDHGVVIVDNQSVKTAEKRGSVGDLMVESGSKGEKETSPLM
ncbi:MAG: hypothetical protein AAF653_11550 [Chloroflexota bacterium]